MDNNNIPIRTIIFGVIIFLIVAFLFTFSSQFFYFFERVDESEVGVQFRSGRIVDVVGPGIYNDAGLFVELQRVSSQAIPFTITDEELITQDKQRIGLTVTGDVFRPGLVHKDRIQELWAQYNQLYLDDSAASNRVASRAKQAMKVCVGNRDFDDAVIGTARDDLRNCIDEEVNKLAANFGLTVENLAVPDVLLSPEVQAGLDRIVQLRLQTEQAQQDQLRAVAEAEADQARQEGEIRVQQSRIQEESRQQKTLAELEELNVLAQKAVIEAERLNELARVEAERAIIEADKSNELLAAEKNLEIQKINAMAALERAKADTALSGALGDIYASNPGFLELKIVEANASALRNTDKLIFTQEGTAPTLVFSNDQIVPTLETAPAAEGGN